MSKKTRLIMSLLLALVLVSQLAPMTALADDYTYTVRVYAGNQGSIGGGSVVTYTDVPYGGTVSFDLGSAKANDDKYYVQGIRKSGQDNDALQSTTIHVTEDADYVVAYGIAGTLVPYTVNYQDAAGNTLAPSQTYYGNVGDKPVVAFLYVDNYEPQAYNLTKTLSENPADNVFTFTYRPLVTTVIEYNTAATPEPVPTAPTGEGTIPAPAQPGTETEPEAEPETEPETVPEPETELTPDEAPLDEGPQDLVDLDETQSPSGNMVLEENAEKENEKEPSLREQQLEKNRGRLYQSIGILGVALCGLGVILALVLSGKKHKASK